MTTPATNPSNPYRLHKNVVPSHYRLVIEPDLDAATFKGEVVISVNVLAPDGKLTAITLNAAELEIFDAKITQADNIYPATITYDEQAETATFTIEPNAELALGTAQIVCSFTGELNDKLRGFYRSTYIATDDSAGNKAGSKAGNKDGDKRVIATTQFESTNARRAFPCFDEPDFKAVFSVSLIVPDHLTAISCGKLLAVEPATKPPATEQPTPKPRPGYSCYRFADTMVMSTYLLAFIVGELEATDPIDVGGVPLRIVHVPGKSHLTEFATEVGAFTLSWLVDYYGIAYPGDKLDLVAVPDFAFGAMENMGCVTFRETLLLANPDTSTLAELSRIVDVVAHEIAHMWFGNLVTMDWWNGIWLKEAFATFMQMSTTHAFRPQWRRWDEFSLERGAAFDVDSLSSTRPIEFDVISPADAEGMYDLLTYEKGAAVVRMLEQFLGPEQFRAGVKLYLERFSYRNVTTTDLWEALEESTGQPVATTMSTWIFQGGYPILEVSAGKAASGKSASKSAGKHSVTLRQRRFAYGAGTSGTPTDTAASTHLGELWHVPVNLRARLENGKTVERRVLLTEDETEVDLGGPCEWVVVNAGGHGFYRARYTAELLAPLAQNALDVLTPVERYCLVDDTFAALLADQTTAAEFLKMVTDLAPSETDLRVWQRMLGGLKALYLVTGAGDTDAAASGTSGTAASDTAITAETTSGTATTGRAKLSQLIRELSTTALGVLGYEPIDGELDLERELRAVLFTAAGVEGQDELVRSQARDLFALANDDAGTATTTVEPNLATAALNVVAATGDEEDYDHILSLYRAASTPQLEQNYLSSLLQFRQQDLFDKTLALARDEVRTQNAPFLLAAAMAHTDHGPRAWKFVKDHWIELSRRFPQNTIARMVSGVRALSTPALAREVTKFFQENTVPQGELIVAQHIEKMWVNVALRERLQAEAN